MNVQLRRAEHHPKRTFLIGRRLSFSDVVALKPQKLRLLLLVSVARTLEAMLLAYDNVHVCRLLCQ